MKAVYLSSLETVKRLISIYLYLSPTNQFCKATSLKEIAERRKRVKMLVS